MRISIHEHPGFHHVERLLSGGVPTPQAADLLSSLGVNNQEQAARSLQSLALHPSFPRGDNAFLGQFLESLGETFEPERAMANLERILESRENPDALLSALRRSSERRSIVLTLAGGSQFLSDTILRHPEYLDWLLKPMTLRKERTFEKIFLELWRWVREAREHPGGPADALRRFRQREYLRIGIRDLLRMASTEETTLSLSNLADATLEAALRISQGELHAQYGKPRWRTPNGRWSSCDFAIIGMGKLGGRELNFSSDIDLIFVYSSDEGKTRGIPGSYTGRRRGQISSHEFYVRLSRRVIQLMAENTEEGLVFRVDTRLRPEGSQGALAYSLRSCEIYYESWGETWERQALIKARHCAGDNALGRKFLEMTRPFIYRRTLDVSALDEIARIKDRINRKLASSGQSALNIKLGEGGIREIEFIIQSFQLIYGGKEPFLRKQNSLQALSAIKEVGLLPIIDCDDLAEAYTFLRDVEHRVQVTHGLQTHDLPEDRHGLTVLARKMGFVPNEAGEKEKFEDALKGYRGISSRIFDDLFRRQDKNTTSEEDTERIGAKELLSAKTLEDSLSPADLAPYNFADPDSASSLLRLMRNGEQFQHVSARAKRTFDELLPRLLYITLDLPDPDSAVANLFRFVEAGGGREAVFSLISESDRVFEALLQLFGTSDYLSDVLIHRPDVFETIIQSGALTQSKPQEEMISEFRSVVHGISTAESRFSALADAKRDEEFTIGMRSILGEADILVTVSDLTRLADTVLKIGLSIAQEELNNLYGASRSDDGPPGFAVIGLGKLGSFEMNFGSDLDLIFVYDDSKGETAGLFEEKPSKRDAIPNIDYFFKLGTLLRDGLASPQVGERIYEIDLRLRPEGQKGSFVTPLEQMKIYLTERAENWERQAFCRARFIAGTPEIGEAFMRLASNFVYETPVPNDFAEQVDHMRKRMELELAREAEENIDIKLGAGGIADIEFTVQYLQILNGGRNPSLRRPDSAGVIQALQKSGLISKKNGDDLLEAYRFLRLVENRLRIANAQSIHALPKTPAEMEILARRIGYEDNVEGSSRAKLLSDYERLTLRVREIYNEIVRGVDEVAREK